MRTCDSPMTRVLTTEGSAMGGGSGSCSVADTFAPPLTDFNRSAGPGATANAIPVEPTHADAHLCQRRFRRRPSQGNLFELAPARSRTDMFNRARVQARADGRLSAIARLSVGDPTLGWQNRCGGPICGRRRFSAWVNRYLAYATSSPFGAPNMKSIPVRAVRIAGLQGE